MKHASGFTLVELLVVITLVAMFSSLSFIAWRSGEGSLAIERAAVRISQDIRRATELSLRAEWTSCSAPGTISGYGLFFYSSFDQPTYVLFADCNNDQKFSSGDKWVQVIDLEKGVWISAISPGTPWSIVIVPPEPAIFIKDSSGDSFSNAQITLSLINNPAVTKVINLNSKGVVNIQ